MSTGGSMVVTPIRRLAAAGIVLALVGVLDGCAGRDQVSPSAMVSPSPPVPAGAWHGTISGREMVDANGFASSSAELTVHPDGTFTLADSSGARATGRAHVAGGTLVLDGTFVAPASRAGEPVIERLRLGRNGALYGAVDTLFRGLKVNSNASLRKTA